MEKYDDVFCEIIQDSKSFPVFLDCVFSFLQRRTDFYHIAKDPYDFSYGLPRGEAVNMVKLSFRKYLQINARQEKHEKAKGDQPDDTTENQIKQDKANNEVKKEHIGIKKEQKLESFNGAIFDNYSWSQTISDLDIQIKLPNNHKNEDLHIVLNPTNIFVKLLKIDLVLLEGEFYKPCNQHEMVWYTDHIILHIHLEKKDECWWPKFMSTESEIDLRAIDCSRPYHELPDDAQSKLEEITRKEEEKLMNKNSDNDDGLKIDD